VKGRPEYLERKIDFHLARQRARRTHPQPCDCPYCITSEAIERRLRANLERNASAWSEVPF